MSAIPWTAGPGTSSHRIPGIPVYNVPPGEETFICFLAAPMVAPVHWVGPRCLPHTGDTCPLCKPHGLPRSNGYAPAQRWWLDSNGKKNWLSIVVSLSDSALLDVRDQDVRGQVWTLFRADKRPRSQLLARFEEMAKNPVPQAFDVVPIVENMWKLYLADLAKRKAQVQADLDARAAALIDDLAHDMTSPLRGNLAPTFQARNGKGGVS